MLTKIEAKIKVKLKISLKSFARIAIKNTIIATNYTKLPKLKKPAAVMFTFISLIVNPKVLNISLIFDTRCRLSFSRLKI